MAYVIGVDVGGTFTDAVLTDESGRVVAAKAPSTPPDYSAGVLDVIELLADQLGSTVETMLAGTHHVAHGTTSSLNALVTGNVPPVGFITTRGHRDSIYIMNVEGRYLGSSPEQLQNVLGQSKSHGLVPKRHAWEVTERLDRDGQVVVVLDEDDARTAVRALLDDGVRAIAVSLLWSFRNPAHERRIREIVHELDPRVFVSLSSEVSPRIREFARNATTIMSTQIGTGLRDYLSSLEAKLRQRGLAAPLLVMQSNGGAVAAGEAPATAISTVGSVLTGGIVSSATATSSAPTSEARHSWSDSSSTVNRCGPPAPSSTITRSTCPRCRCTLSARAAARSPGSTPAATCRSARTAPRPCRGRPVMAAVVRNRRTPTLTSCSASSPSEACSAASALST
jgi:N-methylhydantoinase A